jgi:hypothetical protein
MDNLIRGRWTPADIRTLKKLFPHSDSGEVAAAMNRPYQAVRKMASRMGLRKTRKYMRSIGRT